MGYKHIIEFLNGATEGLGPGPIGYQDAINEVMEKNNLSIKKMKIIFD